MPGPTPPDRPAANVDPRIRAAIEHVTAQWQQAIEPLKARLFDLEEALKDRNAWARTLADEVDAKENAEAQADRVQSYAAQLDQQRTALMVKLEEVRELAQAHLGGNVPSASLLFIVGVSDDELYDATFPPEDDS